MIRHLVFIRFRDDVSLPEREALFAELAGLRDHLDGIRDFQSRRNVSPEHPVTHGFDDMFWFDFTGADTRDAYLEDPQHKAIGARLVAGAKGGTDGVFVCDVEL